MTSRADAVARTRESIVGTARELHAQRGFAATSWDDIAGRAGVSVATVYRHFPSLTELVPACARTVFDIIQPPTLEQAAGVFAQLRSASERFEQLVRSSCHCYLAGSDWLHAAHRERDFLPELDRALDVIEDSLRVLIDAAAERPLGDHDRRLLFVLCDFPIWRSLVDAGDAPDQAESTLVRLTMTEVDRLGLDADIPPTTPSIHFGGRPRTTRRAGRKAP